MSLAAPVCACLAALLVLAGNAHAETPAPGPVPARKVLGGVSELLFGKEGSAIPEPVPPGQAFVLVAAADASHAVALRFEIHDCCYLYRDKLRFVLTTPDGTPLAGGPRLDKVRLPPGEAMTDAYFGESAIYRDSVDLRLPLLDVPRNTAFLLEVTYQGCSEEGVILCYEPLTRRLLLRTVDERLIVESGAARPAS